MRRILTFDRTMRNGMLAGAALGVLTAAVIGVGSSMGAELVSIPGPEEQGTVGSDVSGAVGSNAGAVGSDTGVAGSAESSSGSSDASGAASGGQAEDYGWRQDFDGYRRYYGGDGMVLTNTITPDGEYVDETGVWIPRQYNVSQFTSIPNDAKSLLVIEGHGKAARASFYVRDEGIQGTAVTSAGEEGTVEQQTLYLGPGATAQAGVGTETSGGSGVSPVGETQAGEAGAAKIQDQWKMLIDTAGYVGKNGIGKVQEGDEKSPRGWYTLDEAFGTEPDLGNFKVPYLQVNDGHYWVGDSNSPLYNTMVDIRQTGEVFNTAASEHLSTYGGKAYHYCMSVGYNKERTPYKGSAIFLHCTDGPGTGGCIAIPEAAMVTVLQNIEMPAYILIDEGENLKGY